MGASARWTGQELRFEVSDANGHSAAMDERPPLGAGAGFSPPDLLLAALAACTGITAVSLLQKMRQPLRALTVSTEGDRQPDWPKAFTEIRVHYALEGEGKFDEALVRKAVELATKHYCAVGGTIELGQGGCQILFDYTIAGARPG
jgi:putative redox protein